MADTTISRLSLNSPNKNSAIIPYSDGTTTYKTSPSGIVAASPGSVIQVQSTTSDTVIGPITNNDSALLSLSIKPVSSNSKIHISVVHAWCSSNPNGGFALQRSIDGVNYSNISKGYVNVTGGSDGTDTWPVREVNGLYSIYDDMYSTNNSAALGAIAQDTYNILDTPNTTNTITYRTYWYHLIRNGGTFYLNRPYSITGYWTGNRSSSTITAMEIAG